MVPPESEVDESSSLSQCTPAEFSVSLPETREDQGGDAGNATGDLPAGSLRRQVEDILNMAIHYDSVSTFDAELVVQCE